MHKDHISLCKKRKQHYGWRWDASGKNMGKPLRGRRLTGFKGDYHSLWGRPTGDYAPQVSSHTFWTSRVWCNDIIEQHYPNIICVQLRVYSGWKSLLVWTNLFNLVQIESWIMHFVCIETGVFRRFFFRTNQNQVAEDVFSHWLEITKGGAKQRRQKWWKSHALQSLSG